MRFAIQYIFQSIVSPLNRLIPILAVYVSLMGTSQTSPIPGVTKETYIPFLAIGIIFHTAWYSSTRAFEQKFQKEKWSRTIDLLFIAPIRTTSIIIGVGLSVIVQNIPTLLVFLATLSIIEPPSILGLVIAALSFIVTMLIGLSIGLIYGGIGLSSENMTTFFSYAISGITSLTPFFYPVEVVETLPHPLDTILSPIVRYNPLNMAITLARDVWIGNSVGEHILHLFYLAIIAIFLIVVAAYTFRFTWRKFGLQG